MNILAGFETFLYVISSVLFYPVIIGLVMLTFWIVICFGGFIREYLERKRGFNDVLTNFQKNVSTVLSMDSYNGDINLERLVQEKELELFKSLDKIKFAIRVGPALGLMGTLIPMGIALSALAQGDMPKMAGNMVTAFTTTVVGLTCGLSAYIMSIVKEKWIREDIIKMEFIAELEVRKLNGIIPNRKEEEVYEVLEEA